MSTTYDQVVDAARSGTRSVVDRLPLDTISDAIGDQVERVQGMAWDDLAIGDVRIDTVLDTVLDSVKDTVIEPVNSTARRHPVAIAAVVAATVAATCAVVVLVRRRRQRAMPASESELTLAGVA